MKLQNYVQGKWVTGDGVEYTAIHAITGEKICDVFSQGLDYAAILNYARQTGGPALRKMTFQERGRMLKALERAIKVSPKVYPSPYFKT